MCQEYYMANSRQPRPQTGIIEGFWKVLVLRAVISLKSCEFLVIATSPAPKHAWVLIHRPSKGVSIAVICKRTKTEALPSTYKVTTPNPTCWG